MVKFKWNMFHEWKLNFHTWLWPFHEMDGPMTMNLSISRNGQVGHPFHEMVNSLVHFMKWTISQLGHNIYKNYLRVDRKAYNSNPKGECCMHFIPQVNHFCIHQKGRFIFIIQLYIRLTWKYRELALKWHKIYVTW